MKEIFKKSIPLLIGITFLIIIYLSLNILFSFYIAFFLAYLMLPLVENLSKVKIFSYKLSAIIIYVILIIIFTISLLILIPILYQQLLLLVDNFGKVIQQTKVHNFSLGNLLHEKNLISLDTSQKIDIYIKSLVEDLLSYFSSILGHVWEYTLATLSFLSALFMVPFILFYFLMDWKIILKNSQNLISKNYQKTFIQFFKKLDKAFSNYVRGQFIIVTIMSIYYTIAFTFLKIELALILGLLSGFFIIIPFVGNIISFCIIIANGYFLFGLSQNLLFLTIFFSLGGIIEGWVITPKIIGESTGLHPAWVLFGIIVGGNFLGILGMILAVPILLYFKTIIKMFFLDKKNIKLSDSLA
ncbi:MAG: AI-2E family transporter [Rickettsia sp.]|nr:AI-2E family transporter [Rickettsia sp.]